MVVGDAEYDIVMGTEAGTLTCAVTYGYGSVKDLNSVNPDFIIPSFDHLLSILM